jgi:hypothetical protein
MELTTMELRLRISACAITILDPDPDKIMRLYEDDENRRLDQHPCAPRDLYFWRLLRDHILRSAGAILGPGHDRPSSQLDDVVHDASTRRMCDARSEHVPDACGDRDREHEARLQVGAHAPQGGRGHDKRGPRDGGARGRGRGRGGAA